jgi:oxygen-independent coproporphyrinogen-3 oxidase
VSRLPAQAVPPNLTDLVQKYDRQGPRYTSYPTAVEFTESFTPTEYLRRLERADAFSEAPLSAYVHLPFCDARCTFCGCNVIIMPNHERSAGYLEDVEREFALIASKLPRRRKMAQFHFGGGTPTYQSPAQLKRLFQSFLGHFELTPDAEVACELDPRTTTTEHLETLKSIGFNRVSMGVQDFTSEVQTIINRHQTEEETRRCFQECRRLEFHSINIDLIYGLPLQKPETFDRSMDTVLELRPDRVALYSFAHVPWLKKNQNLLDPKTLPAPKTKLELFALATRRFLEAGYRKIGMDHFAVPEDEMGRAVDERRLYRNFMGYTIQPPGDYVGFGISSIGDVQGAFAQNTKKLTTYRRALDEGAPPIERGYLLTEDDQIRRHVILDIMCNFQIDLPAVQRRFGIEPTNYFEQELSELEDMVREGFVEHEATKNGTPRYALTPLGTFFVRNVAMIFDIHLRRKHLDKPMFSRTV